MLGLASHRLLTALVQLLGLALVVFFVIRLLPADPVARLVGLNASREAYLSSQHALGLDRPVMVHRYPSDMKAFYFKRDPNDPKVALGVDVLAPEGYGEIIGGGQRMDDLELLQQRIKDHKLPEEAYSWYVDLRRYGSVPHSGFGLGIERTVAWICGLEHVRETIPFARLLSRLYP